MVKYYEIAYRVDDPERSFQWAREKFANVVAATAAEAVEKLKDMFRMFRVTVVGNPVEREMTDDEYENG